MTLRHFQRLRFRSLPAALVVALILALLLPVAAAAKPAAGLGRAQLAAGPPANHDNGRGKVVRTMTRNLYLGANLLPAIEAKSLPEFVAANGQILREVSENNFPVRAEGLADEILEQEPDLVGLQEVALWRTAPPSLTPVLTGEPTATTVRYDFLEELLAELNLTPLAASPAHTLSGGERRRLQLLLALTSFPNVLLLDEPTNDLDLDTLRALEDFLETWPGSLVIVSHDRALLERTAEEAMVLDGHGGAAHAPGGYAQYEEARRRRAATPEPRSTPGRAAPSVGKGTTPTTPAPTEKKQRSPSTLRRLIGLAEAEMEKAAAERDGLLADLAAAGNDHVALARIAETLAAAEARLSAAEERWLELSEELGGG
jgi:ABC-type multidrug transport system ATPase subunit